MALTKTNTDNLCPPTAGHNPAWIQLQKIKYRYYLWTGLYMLEPHERIALHFAVGPIVVALLLYVGVFLDGIREGWGSDNNIIISSSR